MNIDKMLQGNSIEFKVVFNGKTMNFKSRISIIIDQSIFIPGIIINHKIVCFSDKCSIDLFYKKGDKLYLWENVKANLITYKGKVYHKLDLNGEGKLHNRREAYRMYLGEDMQIYIDTSSACISSMVLVKDVSEAGVAFITKQDLNIGQSFHLKIKDNNTFILLSGDVVRKEVIENLNKTLYGCKFHEKDHKLAKYIARRQREQLKKKSRFYICYK